MQSCFLPNTVSALTWFFSKDGKGQDCIRSKNGLGGTTLPDGKSDWEFLEVAKQQDLGHKGCQIRQHWKGQKQAWRCPSQRLPWAVTLQSTAPRARTPLEKKNKGLVPAQQAQPGWHQNIFSSPPSRWFFFLVYSLWGGDDGFAGRGGQPLGSLLEAWEITSDWLGVSVFAEGAHLKWQRQLNAENVFSRLW